MIALAVKCLLLVVGAKIARPVVAYARGMLCNRLFWKRMDGKWIAVTGATDGIGKELVLGLARRRQRIILVGRNEEKLARVCEEAKEHGGDCRTVVADFMEPPSGDIFSGYDLGMLINNAGCSSKHPSYVYEDAIEPILRVNVCTSFAITQMVLKKMAERRFGYVMNIGSILSECPSPLLSTYGATKSMIKAWSSSLHYEMKPLGIHVECVIPGFVCTKMSKIRKPSLVVPTAGVFAESVLRTCGTNRITIPYLPHVFVCIFLDLMPCFAMGRMFYHQAMGVRSLALSKKKRN